MYSKTDFYSYGRAMLKIADLLAKVLSKASSHNKPVVLVVPSRGAVTPAFASLYALTKEENLPGLTDMSRLQSVREVNNAELHILLLPLTADTGYRSIIPEYLEKEHRSIYKNTERVIKHIRQGGMHILKLLLSDPASREENKAFRVFTKILELEGRKELANFYRSFYLERQPAVVLIDTAISGSAVSHILQGAHKEGMKLLPIIVADAYGNKLKQPEKDSIQRYLDFASGRPRSLPLERVVIPVRKLLGENRGAALQGFWAAIYPQVVAELVKRETPGLGGSWHQLPNLKPYTETYRYFIQTLLAAVDEASNRPSNFSEVYKEFARNYNTYKREVVQHRVKSGKQLVKEAGLPRFPYHRTDVRENNNRVIHIHFPPNLWIKRIKPYLFG